MIVLSEDAIVLFELLGQNKEEEEVTTAEKGVLETGRKDSDNKDETKNEDGDKMTGNNDGISENLDAKSEKNIENLSKSEGSENVIRSEIKVTSVPNIPPSNSITKPTSPVLGKIVFWSSLFSITDMQLIQAKKLVSINFFEDATNKEFKLKLEVENVILFRDNLVNKIYALHVKVVSQNIKPGEKVKRRLTAKDLTKMSFSDVEKNVLDLKKKIEEGKVDEYTIGTFTALVGKAVEELGKKGDEKHVDYLKMMQDVLKLEKVDKLTEKESRDKVDGEENCGREGSNVEDISGNKMENEGNNEGIKESVSEINETKVKDIENESNK